MFSLGLVLEICLRIIDMRMRRVGMGKVGVKQRHTQAERSDDLCDRWLEMPETINTCAVNKRRGTVHPMQMSDTMLRLRDENIGLRC